MFGRTKLRQILVKHQEEIQTDSKAHFKSASARNTNNNNNKGDNQEKNAKWNDSNDVVGNGMRSTPTLDTTQLFSFNERNFKPLLKTRNEPQIEELDYKNMDIFHRAVCPRQCFALMPVLGVHRPDPRHLRFSFKSLPMLLTLIYLLANSVLTISTVKYLLQIGINAKNFVAIVFFGCVQCACVLFLSLAPRWPRLMRYWIRTELIFTRKPYVRPKRNLAKRIHLAAAVIIFLSMCEHGMYLCSAVYSYTRRTRLCSPLLNTTSSLSFSEYTRLNYKYAFTLLPNHSASGVFVMVTNAVSTFIWNFMDLFIVMTSIGVAYRFEQITMRVKKLADKEIPETVFTEIREHYVKVCELLECIDDNLAGIIMLSCMNNLYFVCYQLLNVFNKLRWPINYLYFWYSLLYLIGRTAFVFLTAASINDESKGSVGVLRRLSNKMWCTEVERLIFLMTTQTVALSGKKFYFLTRRLLFGVICTLYTASEGHFNWAIHPTTSSLFLQMAGTIVTYELVLLQFDEPYRSKGLPELCA